MTNSREGAGGLHRWYIDRVFGSPSAWWWRGWAMLLGVAWLLGTLLLFGALTLAPAARLPLSPESYSERCSASADPDPETNMAWNETLPCDERAPQLEQSASTAVTGWIDYLEKHADEPPANSAELELKNPFFAQWIDRNICTRDSTLDERKARAWLIQNHSLCASTTRWTAVMPLAIWWGGLGIALTLFLVLAALAALIAYVSQLIGTRKAYRILYGSNHGSR